MHLDLRAIVLATLAVVLPLAASGTASAQRVNYVSQTASSVNVSYFDLPVVELVFVSQVSGDNFALATPLVSGSGSVTIPFATLPDGAGQYYVLARQGEKWIAQSVMFYVLLLPPCPEC